MKRLLLSYLVFAGFVTSLGQEIGSKYSGKAEVPELGLVEFPAGEWFLEFQRVLPAQGKRFRPDYFVFRLKGAALERLTFFRYPPKGAPLLSGMLDGVIEMADGVPLEETSEDAPEGLIHPLRLEPGDPKRTDSVITYSFIMERPSPTPNWLCHTRLFNSDGWTFVIAHASQSVIIPATVHDVSSGSRLKTSSQLGNVGK